jgi:hypothetical protein
MTKYICDRCMDSFVKDGLYLVSIPNMEFDLCGRCLSELQEIAHAWLIHKDIPSPSSKSEKREE